MRAAKRLWPLLIKTKKKQKKLKKKTHKEPSTHLIKNEFRGFFEEGWSVKSGYEDNVF